MKKVFITGASGVGKSTLGKELSRRGFAVLDIDKVMGSCNWYENASGKIVDYRQGAGSHWFENHSWNCDYTLLNQAIEKTGSDIVFIVGITTNQDTFIKEFDLMFLIRLDDESLLKRLQSRDTNDFANNEADQQYILSIKGEFEKYMMELGAVSLDGRKKVEELADLVIKQSVF